MTKLGTKKIIINENLYRIIALLHNTGIDLNEIYRSKFFPEEFELKINSTLTSLLSLGALEISEKKGNPFYIRELPAEDKLTRLFIEITNKCNLRCKHCYNSRGDIQNDCISITDFERLIKEAFELGVIYIDVTGGETFSHSMALKLISLASENGMIINLYTNGVLLKKEIIHFLEERKVN